MHCEYFRKEITACTPEVLPNTSKWTWESATAPISCKGCPEFVKHRQKANTGKIIVRKRSM